MEASKHDNSGLTANVFTLLLVLGTVSCSPPPKHQTVKPKWILFNSPGVTVKHRSGTVLMSDQKKRIRAWPPVSTYNKDTDLSNEMIHCRNGDEILGMYAIALNNGAKRVTIDFKGKTIHGVLLLSKVFDDALGSVRRSYNIRIPEPYIESAAEGNISVVYESYQTEGTMRGVRGCSKRGINKEAKAWVLWLSATPF